MKFYLFIIVLATNIFAIAIPGIENFTGNIGVYAVKVDTTANGFVPLEEIQLNPTNLFPLASTFKIFVLLEVMKKINSGQLDWKQKIEVLEKDESLDSLYFRRKKPLKLFIKKMIKISDNTSADICFNLAGLESPSITLSNLGIADARITIPTREFWLMLSGLVTNFPYDNLPETATNYAAISRNEQVKVVESVKAEGAKFSVEEIGNASDNFYSFKTYNQNQAFDIVDNIDNVASPKSMVKFLYHFFFDNGLSEKWNKKMRKLIANGDKKTDRRKIKVKLKYWGGKGGNDLGMETVAGYAETKKGNHIIYAIFGSHMIDEDEDVEIINSLITWVFDTLDN